MPGVKFMKKFGSSDAAVARIWAVLNPDKPRFAWKPKGGRQEGHVGAQIGQDCGEKISSGRKKCAATVRDEAVKLSLAGGASLPELMKAFK